MQIKVKTYNNMDIAVLELRGNFVGGSETEELKRSATELFAQGNRKLIIDMGDVRYLNSTGIGALMNIYTHYRNGDGQFKLCNIGNQIQNVFVITQLVKIFDIEDTIEKAMQSF